MENIRGCTHSVTHCVCFFRLHSKSTCQFHFTHSTFSKRKNICSKIATLRICWQNAEYQSTVSIIFILSLESRVVSDSCWCFAFFTSLTQRCLPNRSTPILSLEIASCREIADRFGAYDRSIISLIYYALHSFAGVWNNVHKIAYLVQN